MRCLYYIFCVWINRRAVFRSLWGQCWLSLTAICLTTYLIINRLELFIYKSKMKVKWGRHLVRKCKVVCSFQLGFLPQVVKEFEKDAIVRISDAFGIKGVYEMFCLITNGHGCTYFFTSHLILSSALVCSCYFMVHSNFIKRKSICVLVLILLLKVPCWHRSSTCKPCSHPATTQQKQINASLSTLNFYLIFGKLYLILFPGCLDLPFFVKSVKMNTLYKGIFVVYCVL